MAIDIETNTELGQSRDQLLMTKWVLKRIDAEKTHITVMNNPTLPVSMAENLHYEMNLLDRFISLGINRADRWGVRESAEGSARIARTVMMDQRERRG